MCFRSWVCVRPVCACHSCLLDSNSSNDVEKMSTWLIDGKNYINKTQAVKQTEMFL